MLLVRHLTLECIIKKKPEATFKVTSGKIYKGWVELILW